MNEYLDDESIEVCKRTAPIVRPICWWHTYLVDNKTKKMSLPTKSQGAVGVVENGYYDTWRCMISYKEVYTTTKEESHSIAKLYAPFGGVNHDTKSSSKSSA